jgi:hypothetical protein
MSNFFHRGVQRTSLLIGIIVGIPILTLQAHLTPKNIVPPNALVVVEQVQAVGPLFVNPANPRYFTDGSGKAVFLTGSHTWDNRQDMGGSSFDNAQYLLEIQQHHHNFIRLWVWEQPKGITTGPSPAQPDTTLTPEIFQRTGPGTAADGGLKFDVTKYNQAHFDRLRQRVIDAGNKGIYVSVMLFDGWSLEQKAGGTNPWIYHPFNVNNNINGLNGDPNNDQRGTETHTLQISTITQAQEAYVRHVIDTVSDLDNVLYEISNESNSDSTAWQYHMIDFIHNYETIKPKRHPVGMTIPYPGGTNDILFASPADWISPNKDGGYDGNGNNPPPADGSKVVILDTDHIWGIGGDRYWAWKSFTRGYNVIYMDPWRGQFIPVAANLDLRVNMGYILLIAERMNLVAMVPHSDLCSSGYCLANPVANGAEYLVYLPNGGNVSVDLSDSPVDLFVEWFNPEQGTIVDAPNIFGGNTQTFSAPFSGDAVLYIYDDVVSFPTLTMTSTPMPPSSTPIQTSTIPPVTQASSTSASPSPTPLPPATPLPCAQGFLVLSGFFFVVVWPGFLYKKRGGRL